MTYTRLQTHANWERLLFDQYTSLQPQRTEMKRHLVTVFEHGRLPIGGAFTQAHFDQLVLYNEKHDNRFFDVGHKRIHFKSYVGVLQVGNLVIEILPKADAASNTDETKWRNVLLDMLHECRLIRISTLTSAHLQLRSASLVDLYFETFLAEVSDLVHQGLVKRYRHEEGNLPVWKGQVRFARHLRHNLTHQERVYSRYVSYDRNNLFNQILKCGLEVLSKIANPHLAANARQHLLTFETISDVPVTEASFRRLRFGRKTERYRAAIQLARLIILNYSPDLKSGREHVLALLFDMNDLFEEYVFRRLQRASRDQTGLSVSRQRSRVFWQGESGRKTIRPDIVIDRASPHGRERTILDTKWKILRDARPTDEDLRQMYAYQLQFEADRAALVYPNVHGILDTWGIFSTSGWIDPTAIPGCGLLFVNLLGSNGHLRKDLGHRLLAECKA